MRNTGLAVAADGTVWTADSEGRKIFAVDTQGTVQRTIISLAGKRQ